MAAVGAQSFDDSPGDLSDNGSPYQGSPSCPQAMSDSASSPAPHDGQRDLKAYPDVVSSLAVPAALTEPSSFLGDWDDLTSANDLAGGLADSDELAWIHPPTSNPAGCAVSNLSRQSSARPTVPDDEAGQQAIDGATTRALSFQADGADKSRAGRLLRANLRTVAAGTAFVVLVVASLDSGSIQPLEHLRNVIPHQ